MTAKKVRKLAVRTDVSGVNLHTEFTKEYRYIILLARQCDFFTISNEARCKVSDISLSFCSSMLYNKSNVY